MKGDGPLVVLLHRHRGRGWSWRPLAQAGGYRALAVEPLATPEAAGPMGAVPGAEHLIRQDDPAAFNQELLSFLEGLA